MVPLLSVYLLCLLSGLSAESRLVINRLLERCLMIFTFAAAQMVSVLQGLSWIDHIDGWGLILANALLTAVAAGTAAVLPRPSERRQWTTLWQENLRELQANKSSSIPFALLLVALCALTVYCAVGAVMLPLSDSYHFEMPLFWVQHHSLTPFPVNNPRVLATSFLAEALTVPGYLYLHTGAMFVVLSFAAGVFSVGIVYALAREAGCSFKAAVAAAALSLGFPDFALAFIFARASSYLAAMWVGASLLFLLRSRPQSKYSREQLTRFGCCVFCFVMGCGSKNAVTLLTPLLLIGLTLTHKRLWLRKDSLRRLGISGAVALVCSGVLWNYVHNQLWYGNLQGSSFMQSHLSQEHGLRSVWTRVSRGAVLVLFDTVWVPMSARPYYSQVCEKAVRLLGGEDQLGEDKGLFVFGERATTPRKGCGLVGIVFLLPGLVLGLRRCFNGGRPDDQAVTGRLNVCVLLLFLVGSFLIVHAVLRWQYIGLLRLMPPFTVMAAPLCGLALEKRWARLLGLGLLSLSSVMFITYDLSAVGRRFEPAFGGAVLKKILQLGNPHGVALEYQWDEQPRQKLYWLEDYNSRELCQTFLAQASQPAVIGFVGDPNAESCWLFGTHYQNKIIPLVDDRKPGVLLDPITNLDYIVFANYDAAQGEWASNRNYQQCFQVFSNQVCLYAAFVNKNRTQ